MLSTYYTLNKRFVIFAQELNVVVVVAAAAAQQLKEIKEERGKEERTMSE